MVEKAEVKAESLLNLDDLLQCPVCYEIPVGQIFQCNEGHHVCGRCKMRLDVCPVCRALFFGTRNYAMEELISNFRKFRALKAGSKSNAGSGSSENNTPARDTTSGEGENEENDEEEPSVSVNGLPQQPPQACKGLFRCLCCKTGNGERLPAARLLNHLRYFHAPDLLEGRSENGEYLQAWQFGTAPGKLVTAIRVADMGIFFLTIEINNNSVCAWLSMAASPWITQVFNYTLTLCGNDREAIFSDCVYSVRSCEGTLRKNGHCLVIKQADARPLIAPPVISGKLSIRRTAPEQLLTYDSPRVVMRIANRRNNEINQNNYNLEPFLQDLQNDVARITRAFNNIGRDAAAVARSEAELRARFADASILNQAGSREHMPEPMEAESQQQPVQDEGFGNDLNMSRNARRRMRRRLRAALNELTLPEEPTPPSVPRTVNARQNGYVQHNATVPATPAPPVPPQIHPPSSSSGPSNSQPQTESQPQNGNNSRNKKKRRHRR